MSSKPKRGNKAVGEALDAAETVQPSQFAGARPEEPANDDGADAPPAGARPEEPANDDQPDGSGEGKPSGVDWAKVRECAQLDQNDRHNALRLKIHSGNRLRYVAGMGWLTWVGTHWQRDDSDLAARLLAQDLVDLIKCETWAIEPTAEEQAVLKAAEAAYNVPADKRSREEQALVDAATRAKQAVNGRKLARRKFAVSTGNANRTAAMLAQGASQMAADPESLDAGRWLFNLSSGTLVFSRAPDPDCPDPDTVRLKGEVAHRDHDRADHITKCADVAYDPDATCPEWLKFLERVQPDPEMRRFVQVFHAYALLLGGNDEQKLAFHYGTGANGKSLLIETLGRLAGTYRTVVSPDTLTGDSQRQGQQASGDIARLHSARFVTVEELPRNAPLREDLIKAVSGGTRLTARFLQREFFEFEPIFTAVLTGNSKPSITGSDYGIWRRVLLVEWGITIKESEKVPFGEMLARFDAERPGILNWLIEGVMLYLAQGLTPFIPEAVTAFTADYRAERDNVGVFAESMIEAEDGGQVAAGVLYKHYTDWCEANGLTAAKQRTFGDRMNELGFKKDKGRVYTYLGIRVLSSPKFDPQQAPPGADMPP